MSSTKTAPAPVKIKLSELIVNPILSGRSPKEIKENAKSLAKEMQAFGEWDYAQAGQFFTGEDGKPHLCAGFTRHQAATEILDWTHGWFFEVPNDPLAIRLKCITTNGGKGVSRFEQGRLFSELGKGVVADDFKGAIADPKNPADWKQAPMNYEEISRKIGKTPEHVRQCVLIFESPEEIASLIGEGVVATNVIITANQWSKGKQHIWIRLIKAAIKLASPEEATLKHLKAIKADVIPLEVEKKDKPEPKEKTGGGDDAETKEKTAGGDSGANAGDSGNQTELLAGGNQNEAGDKPPTKREVKGILESLKAVIAKCDEEKLNLSMSDEDISHLADALVEAGLIIAHLPI